MQRLTRDRAVERFLDHRQRLLVDYVKLSTTVEHGQRDIAEVLLHRFCQSLVDYLSDGYFRIYGDLLSAQAWPSPRRYAEFEATTSKAMAFNDRFGGKSRLNLALLRAELSQLGLALENRFELEDALVEGVPAPALAAV